jgi:hypothetical protein
MKDKINWQEHTTLNKNKPRFPNLGGWLDHISKIIFCLAFVFIAFYYLVWPQIQVNYLYRSTHCLILSKQLEPLSKQIKNAGFHAKFLAFYEVDNKIYNTWANDALNTIYTNPDSYKAVVDQFKVGDYYMCWYDPAHPQNLVLKRGWDHMSIIFFLLTLVVVLISVTGFYRWYRQRK